MMTTGSFPAIVNPTPSQNLSAAQFAVRSVGGLMLIALVGAAAIELLFSLT